MLRLSSTLEHRLLERQLDLDRRLATLEASLVSMAAEERRLSRRMANWQAFARSVRGRAPPTLGTGT